VVTPAVEALARELGRIDGTLMPEGERTVYHAMARTALAFARTRVPAAIPTTIQYDPSADGWNACRAETLARLGGEEG